MYVYLSPPPFRPQTRASIALPRAAAPEHSNGHAGSYPDRYIYIYIYIYIEREREREREREILNTPSATRAHILTDMYTYIYVYIYIERERERVGERERDMDR